MNALFFVYPLILSLVSPIFKQESQKSELPASTLKLIHSGKILKDDDVISACAIKENDFLVVMVAKPKKVVAAHPKVETTAAATATAAVAEPTPTEAAAPITTATTTPAPTATSTPTAPPRAADNFPEEVVTNLITMGFPEAEVRHCLRAAHGNPDVAVEFLTNGIPDGVAEAASYVNATTVASGATPPAGGATTPAVPGRPLQSLRNHPQFDALRRLVQSNPGALQQVLTQIGQQQPDLLAEINANQAAFLEMMNEPVTNASTTTSANRSAGFGSSSSGNAAAAGAMMEGMGGNPAQMAQMVESMSEDELQQMAAMMGLSPEQLRATAQMIGQMPADQLNHFMMQAMGQEGGGDGDGGAQVLRLTEEEMAAVDRLTEMGFDRSEAAQAFLACDKNEALAANLLMDSMSSGGFFGGSGSGNNGNGGDSNDDDDDDDNMYD